ncbi:MAG TPA: pyrroline-5-carboxylate reductase [Syntrophorhabdaceae bacterium]|nr:pyrroline-5-carboxylate reductase [Syntrophorhabdaceae bacterium]
MEKIGIIGLGNMGESILKALLSTGTKKERLVLFEVKDDRAGQMEQLYGLKCAESAAELARKAYYILLAVKPQDAKDAIRTITPYLDDKKILISIMAGVTTSNILSVTGKPVKIVRMMPNICVKVGEGITGITSNAAVSKEERETIQKIFACLGDFAVVTEDLMDAITALGGSGPAFFLLFLEAMIDAGVKIGLPREKAKTISFQVAKGTLKMLEEEKIHPTVMRDMITSPGGTTIAGISVLEERAFKGSVIEAVEKAWRRAKELSS